MADAPLGLVLHRLRQLVAEATPEGSDRRLLHAFVAGRDEAAFAELVRRHGPTVLRVCRRVLGNAQDAEDAFQATFLVLARRAASIRRSEALGSWLHGVAYRLARTAQRAAARRRAHEGRVRPGVAPGPAWEAAWREVQALLDDAIDRLPDKYRSVFVLCCLDGEGREGAARQLGLKAGTVASRLAEARRRLQRRLSSRGISLSAVLSASALRPPDGLGVPPGLVSATARAAVGYVAGAPIAGIASAGAIALAEKVRKAMLVTRLRIGSAVVLALGVVAAVGLAARPRPADGPATAGPAAAPADPPAGKPADAPGETFTYAGRVLDPEGKPLAGARVLLHGLTPGVVEFRERAVSGKDGTFRFGVRRDEFGDHGYVPASRSPPERYVHVGAMADGCGAACAWAGKPEERESLTLWLPAEEVVRGRVVDLEGKGVAGVRVGASVRGTRAAPDHRPLPYDAPDAPGQYSGNLLPDDPDRTGAVTDRDGRFTLRGLGRGWLYDLYVSGPTVVNLRAQLVARPQEPQVVQASGVVLPPRPGPQVTRYGSSLTLVVAPSKPIVGVVRDRATGKPLAGVDVSRPWTRDDDPTATATTDQEGRYRLTGLPAGVHTLKVLPRHGLPYVATELRVNADQPGVAPVTFDIRLDRQPAVRGRVIERGTGKAMRGWVEYRPLAGNPHLKTSPVLATPKLGNHPPTAALDPDGRFLLPVLPGRGVLLVTAEGDHLPARLDPADRGAGVADAADPELIDCRPFPAWPGEFQGYRLIDVPEGKDAEVEIAVGAGGSRPLVVEVPDGKAHDLEVLGLKPGLQEFGKPYDPGKSAVAGLAADEVRRLFVTAGTEFAGMVLVRGEETGPVTVRLKPTGTITGRVVDAEGKPVVGVGFQLFFDDGPGRPGVFVHGGSIIRDLTPAEHRRNERIRGFFEGSFRYSTSEKTDGQGRFRLTGILPDVAFDLKTQLVAPPDAKGQRLVTAVVRIARPTVKPGATLDLGDLRAQAPAAGTKGGEK